MTSWEAHLPPGTAPESLDLLARESLPRAWAARMERAPEAPAVADASAAAWLSYGELDARSRTVAGRFAAAGLRAGDRMLMSASASVALVVAYVAAQRMGLVVVPVNTAYTRREVDHIVGDARPSGALVDDPERAAWLEALDVVCTPAVALRTAPSRRSTAPRATTSR